MFSSLLHKELHPRVQGPLLQLPHVILLLHMRLAQLSIIPCLPANLVIISRWRPALVRQNFKQLQFVPLGRPRRP
jgi:hypothetical protein